MNILTAGESHGPELTAIIDGFPAGVPIDIAQMNTMLKKRQQGYGRGGRMAIEQDHIHITSGIRHGKTLGSPITLVIENQDYAHWQEEMAIEETRPSQKAVYTPRPGHADLVGGLKYAHQDLRNVLERSSARETAIRVAVGALCSQALAQLGITHAAKVCQIGPVIEESNAYELAQKNDLRVATSSAYQEMKAWIQQASKKGTSVGGTIQVCIQGVPAGIGDYTQWQRKLDARLSYAVMSVNAIKAVAFGDGSKLASAEGWQVMDEIIWSKEKGYQRKSNHLGGIEGGMSNGEDLLFQATMKPIPTQYHPLQTVHIHTKEVEYASVERSDYCAVPSASYVVEAVAITELFIVLCEQFTSDTLQQLQAEIQKARERNLG